MCAETMLLPAIPDFIQDFKITYSTASWILSSYMIAGAVMTPIAGKLADVYGKKKILLIIMMVYCTGLLAGGFANSIESMLAARVAQGIGQFPSAEAYNLIFLTTALVSVASVGLALMLSRMKNIQPSFAS